MFLNGNISNKELKMKYTDIRVTTQDKPFFPDMIDNATVKVMLKEDADKYILQLHEELDVLRWRKCINNVPQENYFGNYDWVLVKVKERNTGWENPIPQIAEYSATKNKWHFQNEVCEEYLNSLIVLCWKPIEHILK